MAATTSATKGKSVANGQGGQGGTGGTGGGGAYYNGNGNGNGRISVVSVAQLASIGVLILMMIGLWWQSADPKGRLDKIENNIVDNRRELNDGLNAIRKEIPERYVTQREHLDLQNRLVAEVEVAHRTHDGLLLKAQLEAWKTERDLYIADIVKKIDQLRNDVRDLHGRIAPREEISTMHSILKDRLDQLYALYRETQKAFHDLEMKESPRNGK